MEKINSFQQQIASFDKLNIEEAKKLYIKAINSSDDTLRKLYLDKVILGTMYVVNNYIEKNDLKIFECSKYSIEDIRSAFIEIWIKKIQNGELLHVDKYSSMFNSIFINEVYENLIGDEIVINGQFGINTKDLIDLFYVFIKFKNSGKDFNFTELMNIYKKEDKFIYYRMASYCQFSSALLFLLESMYNNLNFDKKEDLEIAKHKIGDFLRLFINNGLCDKIPNDMVADDNFDYILDNIMYERFVSDVDDVITDENKKKVFHQRYGLDGEKPKTFAEIAEQFGVTKARIQQMNEKSLRDLRMSPKIRKYVK